MKKRILMAVLAFAIVNILFLCWVFETLNIFALLKDLWISMIVILGGDNIR